MSQRQAIQIPVDHNTSLVLEWYVLRNAEIPRHRKQAIRNAVFKFREGTAKAFNWLATIAARLFQRVTGIGKGKIDFGQIEASHDCHLGMRIGSMNR